MRSALRSIIPGSHVIDEDADDDYSVDYSFAMEYSGPPVNHDIPQVVPVDIHRIPIASVVARTVVLKNFSVPVIQPIVKSDQSNKNVTKVVKLGSEVADSQDLVTHIRNSEMVYSGNAKGAFATVDGSFSRSNEFDEAQSSSSCVTFTSGFLEGHGDSNDFSRSLDVDDFNDECKPDVSYDNCSNATLSHSKELTLRSQEISSEISSCEGGEGCVVEASAQGNRTSAGTFCDSPSVRSTSEGSDQDEPTMFPEMPVVANDGKKGLCHRCNKRNRFSEREVCIVCGAKYCRDCVLRAMGSMPEGRKCIACIGFRIDELKRASLGKCSRMLKKLFTDEQVKQIMSSELSCKANQLPSHLIFVNDKRLTIEELVMLQSCPNPPKKIRPGKYWYDKFSGFWGKEGEKPSQIISAELQVGYQIREDVSNGDTNVIINNRRITKPELWMLQAAGIHCEGSPHFWLMSDGSCVHEGMKNVVGNLWTRKRVKIACVALSLPYPSDISSFDGEDVEKDAAKVIGKNLDMKLTNKFLLVGCDQSGTSTIFKQAKIIYGVPFSEDEKQNIKTVIQRNLYSYICILLEGLARFEEDYLSEMRRQHTDEPGPSGNSGQVDESNIYSLSPKLKAFASWLLQIMMSGNLGIIFPAATREYSPLVEELWRDKAFQATYKRRNELHSLPRVANYFLDRAVEITKIDYEPSQMDILYAEGITSSNGVASMEFSFPNSSQNGYMESSDQKDTLIRYELIRVHSSSLGENYKWLGMFEDINLVIYCVSLTDYDEYYEDVNGVRTNKMVANKKVFESIVTHPTLANSEFLLILNKLDLMEEMIQRAPLSRCDWFQDFDPVISVHPHRSNSNNSPPLAQRAFHYVAVKFKRLFTSLTDRKVFVSGVTGLEGDSVDKALRYGREILRWSDEIYNVSKNEWSSDTISMEPSTEDV
ncbi:hypothetical protein ACS0TY_001826 [Phlomoides rotata]